MSSASKQRTSIGSDFIPKEQQYRQAELNRMAKVVSTFDSSFLEQVLIRKEAYTSDQAHLAVVEVFRFLCLKVLENDLDATMLSPSGIVDIVWHTFMLLPKLYNNFCNSMLPLRGVGHPRVIDHNPMGTDDVDREDRYRRTLQLYKEVFGTKPPILFWPSAEEEFHEDDVYVVCT